MQMNSMKGKRIRDWEIESLLGEGGMGQVWRARHTLLNRVFAIKVIARELLSDPKFESLFIREAATQAELQHPHIIPATDFFVEDGLHCLVMPYVEGQSLEDRLESNRDPKTGKRLPLPPQEAMAIAYQVLHALDYAHRHRVIHRDVKPSNILLDQRGDAYLTDFGVALKMDKPRTTSTGKVVGTSSYMSPEQIQRPREMDHRTDVYSFACVLYEMLGGGSVFETEGVEGDTDFFIKESHVKRMPTPLRLRNANVPLKVEAIVTKALAKSPSDRFAGCGEFARELTKATEGTESVIRCSNCATKNNIASPNQLVQAKCTQCARLLLPAVEAKTVTRSPVVWIAVTVLLVFFAFIMMIGWAVTAGDRSRVESERSSLADRLSSTEAAKAGLASELQTMTKERDDLQFWVNAYRNAPATITVRNNSDLVIRRIFMYKADETGAHKDHLGSAVLASKGSPAVFKIPPGTYRFETEGDGGASCLLTAKVEVSASSEKIIELTSNYLSPHSCKLSINAR